MDENIKLFSGHTVNDGGKVWSLKRSKLLMWCLILICDFLLMYYFGFVKAIAVMLVVVVPVLVFLQKRRPK